MSNTQQQPKTPKKRRAGSRQKRMSNGNTNLTAFLAIAEEQLEAIEAKGLATVVTRGTQVKFNQGPALGSSGLVSDAIITTFNSNGRDSVLVALIGNTSIKTSIASTADGYANNKAKFIPTDVLDKLYIGYVSAKYSTTNIYGVNISATTDEEFAKEYAAAYDQFTAIEEIASGEYADIDAPKGIIMMNVEFTNDSADTDWKLSANLQSSQQQNFGTPNSTMESLEMDITGSTKIVFSEEPGNPQMGIQGGLVVRPLITIKDTTLQDATIGELLLSIAASAAMTDKGVVFECLAQRNNYGVLNTIPPLNITDGKLSKIALDSPKLKAGERDQLLAQLVRGDSMLALECDELSTSSIATQMFIAAANGSTDAINQVVASIKELAPTCVIPASGIFDGVCTLPSVVVHDDKGTTTAANMDVSNIVDKAPDLDRLWAASELPNDQSYVNRVTALNMMGLNGDITGRTFRIYFKSEFITSLLQALRTAGLVVNGSEQMTNMASAQAGFGFTSGAWSTGVIQTGQNGAALHGHGQIHSYGHHGFYQGGY